MTAVAALIIALSGISGVHEGATPAQVASHWRLAVHFTWTGEHPGVGLAPLCRRGIVGDATFGGTGDSPDLYFRSAWFFRGVRTDTGLGIGASFARVRRIYGRALRRSQFSSYVVESAIAPRTVVAFTLTDGHVSAIGWGYKQYLGGELFSQPDGVHC